MDNKGRLSASVDLDLLRAASAAVAAGRASSVSQWVNDALRLKLEHDRRLAALGRYVAHYEAAHGVITEDEMRGASRWASERAIAVRGKKRRRAS